MLDICNPRLLAIKATLLQAIYLGFNNHVTLWLFPSESRSCESDALPKTIRVNNSTVDGLDVFV